jgi:hypothetical protein
VGNTRKRICLIPDLLLRRQTSHATALYRPSTRLRPMVPLAASAASRNALSRSRRRPTAVCAEVEVAGSAPVDGTLT